MSSQKTINKPEPETKPISAKPIRCCSCFDDGCTPDQVTPVSCFLGIQKNGSIGIADGYCPLLHNPN